MERKTGTLITWFADRFFGFVHVSEDQVVKSYYLHGTQVGFGLPLPGSRVEFTADVNKHGGLIALNAKILPSMTASEALAGGAK